VDLDPGQAIHPREGAAVATRIWCQALEIWRLQASLQRVSDLDLDPDLDPAGPRIRALRGTTQAALRTA
jgi:hypothetical protein